MDEVSSNWFLAAGTMSNNNNGMCVLLRYKKELSFLLVQGRDRREVGKTRRRGKFF